jgi:uncharacterized protein (DUF983 family)
MSETPVSTMTIEKRRPLGLAMGRGFSCRCPNCGKGKLFRAYLKVVDRCDVCGEDLHHQRADDAPAYFTIVIVGHFIISGVLATEFIAPDAPFWIPTLIWCVLTLLASLWLLPRIKGALVGLQWANRMHGFGGVEEERL